MKEKKIVYVIANFGGPRNLDEIAPFLTALLTDKDVLRTPLPQFLHSAFFGWVARRRVKKVRGEYESMGGKSPIFEDTEAVASALRQSIKEPILTFHRYLPATHQSFIENLEQQDCDEIKVFPMFPQFTYATTGSLARWFFRNVKKETLEKVRWIKSYAAHPLFVKAHQKLLRRFLDDHHLKDEKTILLFSAHGIPQKFVDTGDIYTKECEDSFRGVMQFFPKALGRLSYQSKFGPGEWVKPYTISVCEEIESWKEDRENVVFVPISFTSDHIETLCEIENDYMSVIRDNGLQAYRVPALNLENAWIEAIQEMIQEKNVCGTKMLTFSRCPVVG